MADEATRSRCYRAYKSGVPVNDLANRFGVTRKTIQRWVKAERNAEKSKTEEPQIAGGEIGKSEIAVGEIANQEIGVGEIGNRVADSPEIEKSNPVEAGEQPSSGPVSRSMHPLRSIWGGRALSPVYPVNDPAWGIALKRMLDARGMDIPGLSKRSGVAPSTVRAIIDGRRMGNLATWLAFSRAMRCTVADIEKEASRA